MLFCKNVNKVFGKNTVLDDISVSIPDGQITALIGPNGSGKSTLLGALSLLDPPDSGQIVIDDISYEYPKKNGNDFIKPWPKLTMIFQQLFLWPHLTIRQNIALPIAGNVNGITPEKVDEVIGFFDLYQFIDRYPNEVSLGQRQRAAIARATALEPKYLLLDEITSALDIEYVNIVLNHLKTLRDKGVGILLVTHYMGFARQTADQILFMWNGKVVESGGPELLAAPTNKNMKEFLALLELGH